ncbi:MAG: rhodanese-like domain-containing protein [Pseudolysinimonas sp.]|uniref:rhodanese-like domain-containing protein n=1 Tax=Pseudolysinimonas sp. TaxID=2680009 RepID=UPI003C7382DB
MTITAADLAALGADATIIDVREPHEFAEARLDGATNVPLGDLPSRLAELPRDRTIYVMCLSGGRSARATAFLRGAGFDAIDVEGGISRWYQAGFPVETGVAA